MSHLSSQTFKTLIQIFSHCRDFNQPPKLVSFSLSRPDTSPHDDGEKTRDNEFGSGEFVGSFNVGSEKSAQKHGMVEESSSVIGLREPNETGAVIDEIARLMSFDDDVDVLSQNDLIRVDTEEDNRPNIEIEKMMIDELEHIVNNGTAMACETNAGQEVRLDDHNCPIAAQRNESNDQEENLDLQRLDVSELEEVVQDDGGCCHQKDSDAVNLSCNINVVDHLAKPSENEETHIHALETENGTQHKNGDRENLVDSSTALSFPQTNTENEEETEEGEISSGHVVDKISIEESLANNEKIDMMPVQGDVSKDVEENNKVKSTKQNQAIEQEPGLTCCSMKTGENISHGGNVVTKKGNRDKTIGKLKNNFKGKSIYSKEERADGPINLVKNSIFQKQGMTEKEATSATRSTTTIFYGDIWNENSNKEVTAVEKDSGVNKKKRKQRSEESKMRKKKKERIKRAKKNRELGVKRLKLLPVEKPKTVVYCRHYLQGRCHEGEKCKFSHDTVPLTKSKPCLHFARQSCMKGDDCPFDHDLSKYSCHSYTSKGSCPRGKDCLFSHKVVSNEGAAVVPVSMQSGTPPFSGSLSSGKQPYILASQRNNMLFDTAGMSSKNAAQKKTRQTPERSAVDAAGKPLLSSSINSKVDDTLSKNRDIRVEDHKAVAGTNSRQTLKTPPAIPKGINFLSFGKSSLGTLASTVKSDGGGSILEKSLHEQDGAVVLAGVDKSTANKVNQRFSEVMSHPISSEMPTATLPLKPQKSESRLFGRSSSDDANANKQAHPPPSCNITDRLVQGEHNAPSKNPSLSFIPQVLPSCPPSSGQSSGHSVFGTYKNTSNSAQKAISSTLAFAARCEREMKKNQSPGNFASDTRANKESNTADPSSDSAKALKILDFLSGIGKKKS